MRELTPVQMFKLGMISHTRLQQTLRETWTKPSLSMGFCYGVFDTDDVRETITSSKISREIMVNGESIKIFIDHNIPIIVEH